MKTHRRETIAILAKYLRTDDPDALQEAYEAEILGLFPQKPYPTTKGIQTILREFGAKDPAARAARPEQFVDLSFIKDLDSSGFIDRLYKSSPQAVAKVNPTPEPVPAPMQVTPREKPAQPETKAKAATTEEKAKPAAKTSVAVAEKAPPAKSGVSQEYVVQLGDTLSKLSKRYYNSFNKWDKIFEANRDTLKNPNYIYVGMKLTIPPDA